MHYRIVTRRPSGSRDETQGVLGLCALLLRKRGENEGMNDVNLKRGRQFSSEYQPAKRGRKPSHLKKWLKEDNVSTRDIRQLFSRVISGAKTIADIEALLIDPNTPPIVLFPLRALLDDFESGKITTLMWLAEYAYGKPVQEQHLIKADVGDELTPQERGKLIEELLDERQDKTS